MVGGTLSGDFELGYDGMKWTKLAYLCSVMEICTGVLISP